MLESQSQSQSLDQQEDPINSDTDPESEPPESLEARKHKLRMLLPLLTCSRDVDSIAVITSSVAKLIDFMEDFSVIKLSRQIGNVPTTSSRHSIRHKIHNNKTGQSVQKQIALHKHQNINLGTVTSNNIKFHLNVYCLKNPGSGTSALDWRPFTTCGRVVIAAAMNLARMLQCGRARQLKIAYEKYSLSDVNDQMNKEEITNYLDEKIEKEENRRDRTPHWISGGEVFYLKSDTTKYAEISACKTDALPFFRDFELSFTLVSLGILGCGEIWERSLEMTDKELARSANLTTRDLKVEAQTIWAHKAFTLTAAGTKHDFVKHKNFDYIPKEDLFRDLERNCDAIFKDAESDFAVWLEKAGKHNIANVLRCFQNCSPGDINNSNHQEDYESGRGDLFDEGVRVTVDDALSFQMNDVRKMLVPASAVCATKESADRTSAKGDEGNSVSEIKSGEESNDDEDYDEDEGDFVSNLSIPKSLVGRYSLLLNDKLATYHTGKMELERVPFGEGSDSAAAFKFVRTGQQQSELFQLYVTAVKNTKYAGYLKNISCLSKMEKASYGLMQPVINDRNGNYRGAMNKCLDTLVNLDFGEKSESEILSRRFCLRLECFRVLDTLNPMDAKMHRVDFPVLDIEVLVVSKGKILRNYCRTLNTAKQVITKIFSSSKKTECLDDAQKMSPEAKMVVQYCSEIIAFDLGTPSGYSRMGPIMKALTGEVEDMRKIGVHFPSNGILVAKLTDSDRERTGLTHGLIPSVWNFNYLDGARTKILRALNILDDMENGESVNTQQAKLTIDLVDRTRKQLGSRIFRYERNNKDRDLAAWQLFVSEIISGAISKDQKMNAFDAIDHGAFVNIAKDDEQNGTEKLEKILDGLASIFWICYDWEWRSDVLNSTPFNNWTGYDPEQQLSGLNAWPRSVNTFKSTFLHADRTILDLNKQPRIISDLGK